MFHSKASDIVYSRGEVINGGFGLVLDGTNVRNLVYSITIHCDK